MCLEPRPNEFGMPSVGENIEDVCFLIILPNLMLLKRIEDTHPVGYREFFKKLLLGDFIGSSIGAVLYWVVDGVPDVLAKYVGAAA
ncbi:hypothetical protein HG530_011537 [Fusarium avenaceum]|nr:hypothetical protein HG530_011537 [Fusarium avenaceum]